MKIALIGMPNCGKTSLFNALTGAHQKVGNYPGVTVERKEGWLSLSQGRSIRLVDLPGIYSLEPRTPDEMITRDVILGRYPDEPSPQLFAVVLDASRLQQNLRLLLEIQSLGVPCVALLNMVDIAQKSGIEINSKMLSEEIGIPVVPTIATSRAGVQAFFQFLEQYSPSSVSPSARDVQSAKTADLPLLYRRVDQILQRVQVTQQDPLHTGRSPQFWTEKVDRWVLHPVWGSLLLLFVLVFVFQAVFNWAQVPQEWMREGVSLLSQGVRSQLSEGPLRSLLVDGVIAGVGSVLVFLPQILLLFLFLLFLEDSGYMARAALLMDRLMGKVGLHGRAFIPLLSSFACAIPGIMATRTIENPRDRLATILIAPLMTCSARLPVYALLMSAFIPNTPVLGPFRLQGLVLVGLYLAGLLAALGVAWVLRKSILSGPTPLFLMELPIYRWPSAKSIALGLLERAKIFVRRAGTVILTLSILIWFFVSYPAPSASDAVVTGQPAIYSSFAGQIGRAIEPLFRPIGFNWQIVMALIPGLMAREVMVGALGTVYAVEASQISAAAGAPAEIGRSLPEILAQHWSLPTALSLLVWYVLACQCASTLAVTRRETNSWRWPILMFGYMTVLAYWGAWVTYRVSSWVVGSSL